MKLIYCIFCLALLFATSTSKSQTQEDSKFGIRLSGFVKADLLYDSRQTYSFREGHFLLYPLEKKNDANDVDLNAKDQFNIMAIQTRALGHLTGPDAFGAKTSGLIECEFFGTNEGDLNGFRMRHAYLNLDWDGLSLLAGQFWHPMFVTEVFPGTLGFNTGSPFQPFTRNPQVRLTKKFGDMKVIAAAISQRDFQSIGPDGASTTYLRNALMPNLHLQFQYKTGENVFGAGGDYKTIMPRTKTSENIKTDETISTFAALAYVKLDLKPVTFKLEGIYGQNLADMLLISGYAVKSRDDKGFETYTPQACYSVWCDISTGKELEIGLFAAISKNLETADNFIGNIYSRAGNISQLIRVSPRILWNSGKTRIAGEVEYTGAQYGNPDGNDKGKFKDTYDVSNIRVNFALYYFF